MISSQHPPGWQTTYRIQDRTLIIELPCARRVLSSAVHGGGVMSTRYILNHQVPANPLIASRPPSTPRWSDPSRYLGGVARKMGITGPCVALMTAVDIERSVMIRESDGELWVEGFFTIGTTNAVRAGEPGPSPGTALGTINMILLTNARLPTSALVGAVQVATESKTAVLLEHDVRSQSGSRATGTGTDAVVIVSGSGPGHRFSGTHTKLGELLGRAVFRGVERGLILNGSAD